MEELGFTTVQPTAAEQRTINGILASLVSPDLAMGLRMNVNRPIGNGRDDGDGIDDLYDPEPLVVTDVTPLLAAFSEIGNTLTQMVYLSK